MKSSNNVEENKGNEKGTDFSQHRAIGTVWGKGLPLLGYSV